MVVLSFISNNDETAYMEEVQNCLQLSASKTKELEVDLSRYSNGPTPPLNINSTAVEMVSSFTYLSVLRYLACTYTSVVQNGNAAPLPPETAEEA